MTLTNTTSTNGTPRVSIRSEPMTYRPTGPSYFRDLVLAEHPERERGNQSRERLLRHEHELRIEMRAPQVTYADPPLWLVEQFATAPRPDRTMANQIAAAGNLIGIPQRPGFSSINTFRLTTGTQTGQETPGAPVVDQDVQDAAVPGDATPDLRDPTTASQVVIIAGSADIPLPMLEQSGAAGAHMDAVLWKDLSEDFDQRLEFQLLSGSGGTGPFGQLVGLLNITATNNITYTDASPTVTKLIEVQATLTGGGAAPQAVAAIGNKRKRKPQSWMMTSSRAAWITSGTLDFPAALANQIGPGALDLLGYPIVQNDSIPTTLSGNPGSDTLGQGTQDCIVCWRPTDAMLFESAPTMNAFTETISGNLEARVQYRCHVGALLGRYPTGISVIGGTGLAVQTALGF
jgi:hypothetical protein